MNLLLISLQEGIEDIGLKTLHYYLLKNNCNSSILYLPDFNANNDIALENINSFVSEISPGLVGISLMSVMYYNAQSLTKYLKKNFKSVPIIWGGIHPTISPETCLESADYVCIGEGERTILDVAKTINNGGDIKEINNICYSENGNIKRNPLYPLIENLDEFSQFELVSSNSFIQEKNRRILPLSKKIFKRNARYSGTIYSIITSRGCPFSCTYCCNNFLSRLYNTKKVRRRSIENIISELEKAVTDNPDIEYINFHDDCFLVCSKEHLKRFCEIYAKKIKKPFLCRSVATDITRERLKYLKDAGMSWISLGLQSGSDRVCRDIYNRKTFKADFLRAAGIIKEFNCSPIYDIILDNPFENEQDKLETIQTLMETPKPYYTQFFSLSLYVGTDLYEKAKKECPDRIENYLEKNYLSYHKETINAMARLATFLDKKFMTKLVSLYKQDPAGYEFKLRFFVAKLVSAIIFEPLNSFQLIKLAHGGSTVKAFMILPRYFKQGIMRYIVQFKS